MKPGVYKVSDLPTELVDTLDLKGDYALYDKARGGSYHFFEVELLQSIKKKTQQQH